MRTDKHRKTPAIATADTIITLPYLGLLFIYYRRQYRTRNLDLRSVTSTNTFISSVYMPWLKDLSLVP